MNISLMKNRTEYDKKRLLLYAIRRNKIKAIAQDKGIRPFSVAKLRRMCKQAGCSRVSIAVYDQLNYSICNFIRNVLKTASEVAAESKRKLVTPADINWAVGVRGINVSRIF